MAETFASVFFALVPVMLFLLALIYLDSYKLVRFRWVLLTITLGALGALGCYLVNAWILSRLGIPVETYSRYVAPLIEETLKCLFLAYLIRSQRVGFLVDAAIYGFAVGTGFSLVENIYYLQTLGEAHPGLWLLRGCGTAIMHGGTTAIFAIMSRGLSDRGSLPGAAAFLPGFGVAVAIHSGFNHFFVSPLFSTLGTLLLLPPLLFLVFERSEKALRQWLNVGFDADTEMLELINAGELSSSRVGTYLYSLKSKFRGEIVADMLCYLKIHLELSLRAKGLLMMREHGFQIEMDEETKARFTELSYLEKSIGRTGKLAMMPFLRQSDKELWQLYMLGG